MMMKTLKDECREVHHIWLEEATGRPLTPNENAIVAGHLSRCKTCSVEAQALEQIEFSPALSGAPPIDDLSKRRRIDDVLSLIEQEKSSGAIVSTGKPFRSRRRAVIGGALAAGIAVMLGIGYLSIDTAIPPSSPPPREDIAAAQPRPLVGYVLLSARTAKVTNRDNESTTILEAGARVRVEQGRAVLRLADRVTVFLGDESEMAVEKCDAERIEISLERGHLLASLEPNRTGPDFVVATRAGRVAVTGTVFSVISDRFDVATSVFRGKVRLFEGGGETRDLRAGEQTILGGGEIEQIPAPARTEAEELMKTLDLLASGTATTLEIESVPPGAEVKLDDVVLGRTPIIASVRAGHRRLKLALEDHTPVRELINLGENDTVARVFDLTTVVNAETDEEKPARRTKDRMPASSVEATPEELLARAQSFRAMRDWSAAAQTYRALLVRYPKSAEARSSHVSLGTLLLERVRQPAEALRLFDRYLAGSRSGTLAQEAAHGRAEAFRSMGDRQSEADALRRFVRDFPTAIETGMAKKRLKELEGDH